MFDIIFLEHNVLLKHSSRFGSLFTVLQRDWVNEYHRKCREVVGAELERQGRKEALEWLVRETEPIV